MSRWSLQRIVAACTALLLVVQADWSWAKGRAPEGPILVIFTREHGLTVSDLQGVGLALLALGLWFAVVLQPAQTEREGTTSVP